MIDTHCHLTFDGLADRVDNVISDAIDAGVDRMISVGTTPGDAREAAALAEQHRCVYGTVGLHPHYAEACEDETALREAVFELIHQPKVVALGEMGLDKHYDDPPLATQERALGWQLKLADELPGRPIIIHNRKATEDTLAALRDSGLPGDRFVFHCFTGDADEARAILDFGAMISVTGIVTFNNAREVAEAIDQVPLDRLMIETDSPFCTPEPHRRVRPNEPQYVPCVARFLADRWRMDVNTLASELDANAGRFFGLN